MGPRYKNELLEPFGPSVPPVHVIRHLRIPIKSALQTAHGGVIFHLGSQEKQAAPLRAVHNKKRNDSLKLNIVPGCLYRWHHYDISEGYCVVQLSVVGFSDLVSTKTSHTHL